MPPKRSSQPASSAPSSSLTSAFTPTKPSSSVNTQSNNAQDVLLGLWNSYLKDTPQRVKLVDCFMAFLVVVGVLQFVYAVVGGSYVSFPLLCLKENRRGLGRLHGKGARHQGRVYAVLEWDLWLTGMFRWW